jgi:hypothetical protein
MEVTNEQKTRDLAEAAEAKLAGLQAGQDMWAANAEEWKRTAGAFEAKLAEAAEDTARLDWLEGELARESAAYYDHAMGSRPPVPALFRRNVPITRAAIDAARMPK